MSWYSVVRWLDRAGSPPLIRAADLDRIEQGVDKLATWLPTKPASLAAPVAGQWYIPGPMALASTSGSIGPGTLRSYPVVLRKPTTISALSVAVTAAGSAGALYRMGVYADDGTGFPGALLADAGTVDAGAIGNPVATLASPLVLQAGVYWFAGVLQGTTTTQPTIAVGAAPVSEVPFRLGTTAPGSTSCAGYSFPSVTGALPTPFSTSAGPHGSAPRISYKAT